MKTLVNRETLICDECGTDLLVHENKNGEIFCNLCEDQRILKSNQISFFDEDYGCLCHTSKK